MLAEVIPFSLGQEVALAYSTVTLELLRDKPKKQLKQLLVRYPGTLNDEACLLLRNRLERHGFTIRDLTVDDNQTIIDVWCVNKVVSHSS